MPRVGWVFLFLLLSPALRAWDVTVGSSFKISGLTRAEGKVKLPLERGKYTNVRVLDRATYQLLSACTDNCIQPVEEFTPMVAHIRPARTQARMWIAEVDFLPSWRMSVLVFKKGENFTVKFPAHVEFLNMSLKEHTRKIVLQAILQEEK